MPAPKILASVSRAAMAKASPPMPKPARIFSVGMDHKYAMLRLVLKIMMARTPVREKFKRMSSLSPTVISARRARKLPRMESRCHATAAADRRTKLPMMGVLSARCRSGSPNTEGTNCRIAATNSIVSAQIKKRGRSGAAPGSTWTSLLTKVARLRPKNTPDGTTTSNMSSCQYSKRRSLPSRKGALSTKNWRKLK